MEKTFVVCGLENDPHVDDSQLVFCEDCNRKVWVTLKNMDKAAICLDCMRIRVDVAKAAGENVEMFTTTLDLLEALNHLMKKRKK